MVINNCGDNRCRFCVRGSLDTDTEFTAVCSNVKHTVSFDVTCKTGYCIYLLSCKICSMKYVGKTTASIRVRLNGHRGNIRHKTEAFVMLNHFAGTDGHGISNMAIKPIELCTDKNTLNIRERFWIAELNTAFPYGLNMDVSFAGIKNAYEYVNENKVGRTIYSIFNKVISTRGYSGGKKKRNANVLANEELAHDIFDPGIWLIDIIDDNPNAKDIIHILRTEVHKLTLINLKGLFLDVTRRINAGEKCNHHNHLHIYKVTRDICLQKLQKLYESKSTSYITIKHVNKMVEKVQLNRIFRDTHIASLFPVKSEFHSKPTVSYSYSNSVRAAIVNYRQAISDPDHENVICNCNSYPDKYIDVNHGHIYTGDMDLVSNDKLRSLLYRGLGYHEQQSPNKEDAFISINKGLDSYISSVSNILSSPIASFVAWKKEILYRVNTKLTSSKQYEYNNVLSQPGVKDSLNILQKDFVFIPVDKASKNIAIVCKRYYLDTMTLEIENSQTFTHVNGDEESFVDYLKSSLPMKLDNLKLPTLFATAKMHKNPKKFRFITAARDTLFSSLSTDISKCLNLLVKFARKSFKYRLQNIDNSIFIVDNRDKVINFLEASNQDMGSKKCISSWDFSTLYTKIPHDKLKDKMNGFINKVMDDVSTSNNGGKFISCSNKSKSAYFSKTRSSTNVSFSKEDLVFYVNIIIDNCYILYHGKVFKQVIGIPMGTNCAPFLANIFLHTYEYEYLQKLISNGETDVALKLSNMFRYQDDCIALNDDSEFSQHYLRIYPPEMNLESTNLSANIVTFLDLRISIFRGKFLYRSYDKRDDFSFDVCNYPDLHGNVPITSSYGVFMSQLVRFCDINQQVKSFISDVKLMTNKFLKQGFVAEHLKTQYLKFCDKYLSKWAKYGVDISRLHII